MSSFESGGQEYDPDQKNTEPISDWDRKVWASIAKMGQFTPKDFKAYMIEWFTLNQPLIPIGQVVGFQAFAHRVLLRRTTNHTVGNAGGGASGLLTWDTEVYDPNNMHDNSTNPERITIVEPGVYLILANLKWATNTTGNRGAIFQKNGATVQSNRAAANPTAGEVSAVTVILFDNAATGDYFTVSGYQTSGGDLAVASSDGGLGGSTEFSAIRLSS